MTSENVKMSQIDPETVRQFVWLSGLDLPLDRAAALLPGLQEILQADARMTQLDLGVLTIVGLPWSSEVRTYDQH